MNSPLRSIPLAAGIALVAVAVPVAAGAPPGILYAADAGSVRISRAADGMRMSLPASTRVTWFTDRPDRRAGTTTMRGLAGIWSASGFASDPPNAAVIIDDAADRRTHVVTMSRPRLTADGRRVSYRIVAVPDGAEAGHVASHDLRGGRYRRAQLFIDDAAEPPCPNTVYSVPPAGLSCLLSAWDQTNVRAAGGGSDVTVSACMAHGTPGAVTVWAAHRPGWPNGTVNVTATCPAAQPLTVVVGTFEGSFQNVPGQGLPAGIIRLTATRRG